MLSALTIMFTRALIVLAQHEDIGSLVQFDCIVTSQCLLEIEIYTGSSMS